VSGKTDKTVAEFVQLLEGLERFLAPPLAGRPRLVRFIRDLRDALSAHPDLTPSDLLSAIRANESRRRGAGRARRASLLPDELKQLPLERAIALTQEPGATKQDLIALAQHRFEGRRGTLQSLTKDGLRERLMEMVEAERTHASIGRMALNAGGLGGTQPGIGPASPKSTRLNGKVPEGGER
jgi:hypothetical protein